MGRYEAVAVKSRPRVSRWLIPVIVLLVLAIAAGAAWYIWNENEFSLTLTLHGDSEITVEYGTPFADPGAAAAFSGTLLVQEPRDVTVQVTGRVDDTMLGTYRLTYIADMELDLLVTKLPFTAKQVRTVTIVDTQAPQIQLQVQEGKYTLPGHPYEEEGFTALDNYDGDLTGSVARQETDGTVTYTVSDSSGNTATVQREIYYFDPEAPKITMLGMDKITIGKGIDFVDPGCTAVDNADGDITERITVSGDLNTEVPGTYTLTYNVSDTYGNTDSCTRQVTVKDIQKANVDKPAVNENKIIYLTFDDGPCYYTNKLLDVLDKYDVKVTFFVIHSDEGDLLARMAASGHKVAMHAYEHEYKRIYKSQEAYFKDLDKIQAEIFQYTGQKSMLLRFPGGGSNTVSRSYCRGIMTALAKALKEKGYAYTDWNVDSNDAGGATSSDEVYNNVIRGISGHKAAIVLQHDIKPFSVNAVERIIQWGIANGYTFRALTDEGPVWHQTIQN